MRTSFRDAITYFAVCLAMTHIATVSSEEYTRVTLLTSESVWSSTLWPISANERLTTLTVSVSGETRKSYFTRLGGHESTSTRLPAGVLTASTKVVTWSRLGTVSVVEAASSIGLDGTVQRTVAATSTSVASPSSSDRSSIISPGVTRIHSSAALVPRTSSFQTSTSSSASYSTVISSLSRVWVTTSSEVQTEETMSMASVVQSVAVLSTLSTVILSTSSTPVVSSHESTLLSNTKLASWSRTDSREKTMTKTWLSSSVPHAVQSLLLYTSEDVSLSQARLSTSFSSLPTSYFASYNRSPLRSSAHETSVGMPSSSISVDGVIRSLLPNVSMSIQVLASTLVSTQIGTLLAVVSTKGPSGDAPVASPSTYTFDVSTHVSSVFPKFLYSSCLEGGFCGETVDSLQPSNSNFRSSLQHVQTHLHMSRAAASDLTMRNNFDLISSEHGEVITSTIDLLTAVDERLLPSPTAVTTSTNTEIKSGTVTGYSMSTNLVSFLVTTIVAAIETQTVRTNFDLTSSDHEVITHSSTVERQSNTLQSVLFPSPTAVTRSTNTEMTTLRTVTEYSLSTNLVPFLSATIISAIETESLSMSSDLATAETTKRTESRQYRTLTQTPTLTRSVSETEAATSSLQQEISTVTSMLQSLDSFSSLAVSPTSRTLSSSLTPTAGLSSGRSMATHLPDTSALVKAQSSYLTTSNDYFTSKTLELFSQTKMGVSISASSTSQSQEVSDQVDVLSSKTLSSSRSSVVSQLRSNVLPYSKSETRLTPTPSLSFAPSMPPSPSPLVTTIPDTSTSFPVFAIAGGAVGGLAVLVVVIVTVIFLRRKTNKVRRESSSSKLRLEQTLREWREPEPDNTVHVNGVSNEARKKAIKAANSEMNGRSILNRTDSKEVKISETEDIPLNNVATKNNNCY